MFIFSFFAVISFILFLSTTVKAFLLNNENVPKLLALNKELVVQDESTVTIVCSISSGETKGLIYEWHKDNQFILPEQNKIKIITDANNDDSKIKIFNVTRKDEGLYKCIARNSFGEDFVSTKLTVKSKLIF